MPVLGSLPGEVRRGPASLGNPYFSVSGRRCLDVALLCTSCFIPAVVRGVWILYYFPGWGIRSSPWAAQRGLGLGLLLVLRWRRLSVSWLRCCRVKAPQGRRLSETGLQQLVPLRSSKITAPDCLCASQSSMKSVLAKKKRSVTSPLCGTPAGDLRINSRRTPSSDFPSLRSPC